MIGYLLNVVYAVLLIACSPALLLSAVRKKKYRAGWAQKLLGLGPKRESRARCIWLHAVSLGEVSLIAPLIDELRRRHPDDEIAISTTTITGYMLAKSRYSQHIVFYCPLDFTWAVKRALRRIRPDVLALVELELWPNLVAAAKDAGVNVAIINGRLSDRSFAGYLHLRWLAKRVLGRLDLIAAQNARYAERFLALGAPDSTVFVTGSLKFDGAVTNRENSATTRLSKLAGFQRSDVVLLAGSTQEPEELLALDTYRQLSAAHPSLRLVLVPRHPERFEEVARMLSASSLPWQRRTRLDVGPADPHARILLVDRVGELAAWWGTAHIAYVGGSMGKRNGQNMIEPAAYGAAVSFGPRTRNFRDIVLALMAGQGAIVVRDGGELTAFVRCCLENPQLARELGQRAQRVVASQLGAAGRTADLLDSLVAPSRAIEHVRRTAA